MTKSARRKTLHVTKGLSYLSPQNPPSMDTSYCFRRSKAAGACTWPSSHLCLVPILRMSGAVPTQYAFIGRSSVRHTNKPTFITFQGRDVHVLYRVIKKSLCTWWLHHRKLQVMLKVPPPVSRHLLTCNGQRDTRLTITPFITPNSDYVIMVSD
jgi:hypothetical protein